MQAISIWGLILAFVNLSACAAELAVNGELPGQPNYPGVLSPFESIINTFDTKISDIISLVPPGLLPIADNNGIRKDGVDESKIADSLFGPKIMSNSTEAPEVTTFPAKISGLIVGNFSNFELSNEIDSFFGSSKYTNRTKLTRFRRHASSLDIDIPLLRPIYRGPDERPDSCERDEIFVPSDGECHELLSQGPCEDTQFVLMDPNTKKGYCAPRLCSPDRVFVFNDQKCHDPHESNICPPGRQLFTSSFGSPVCGCPYGTYEEEDDPDEDVCKPVLGKLEECAPGEVFWFRNFRREPECLPDPCNGLNSRRSANEPPYVPSIFDGKCYQLGQELPQCPEDTYYSLSFTNLVGVCVTLEDSGYTILDDEMIDFFANKYGSRLPQDDTSSFSFSRFNKWHHKTNKKESEKKINSVTENEIDDEESNKFEKNHRFSAQPFVQSHVTHPVKKTNNNHNTPVSFQVFTLHPNGVDNSFAEFFRSLFGNSFSNLNTKQKHSRKRRAILPHASPFTVFQPSLASCRAGSARGILSKCLNVHTPSSSTPLRFRRNIPPVLPNPRCLNGQVFNIQRRCVWSRNQARNSVLAHGLG